MQELHVDTPRLTAFTMDPILDRAANLAQAQRKRREDARLLLEEVEFIDPYGLVSLWVIVRFLRRRFRRVRVILPEDRDLQSYLRRMNFPAAIQEAGRVENDLQWKRVPRKPSDVLLEMTPIEKQADVVRLTRDILTRIKGILKAELQYQDRDITAFSTVVAEVCTNVFDHSEDTGMVTAQRYTKGDGTKYAIVAVADLGIGMRQSLETRYREAGQWSHLQAIVNALKKEYSRRPERGLGLFMVSKIVGDYRGSLHIRSGDARLYLRYRARGISCALFPGTQVSISLSARTEEKS